jgi:hypothetical protein
MSLSKHRQLVRLRRRCSEPDQIDEHDDALLLEDGKRNGMLARQ